MGRAEIFERLLRVAMNAGIQNIVICSFQSSCRGVICGDSVALSGKMNLDQINETLAHEIAHLFRT